MDAALDDIKSNPDPAARKAAAEQVNKIFGEQVYNLWLIVGAVGDRLPAVRQRARAPTSCPTAARASASPSPAGTRSTRSGATTATATDRRVAGGGAGVAVRVEFACVRQANSTPAREVLRGAR